MLAEVCGRLRPPCIQCGPSVQVRDASDAAPQCDQLPGHRCAASAVRPSAPRARPPAGGHPPCRVVGGTPEQTHAPPQQPPPGQNPPPPAAGGHPPPPRPPRPPPAP